MHEKICCAADDQDIVDLLILDPPHSREPLIVIIGSQRSFFPSELSDFSLPRVCSVEWPFSSYGIYQLGFAGRHLIDRLFRYHALDNYTLQHTVHTDQDAAGRGHISVAIARKGSREHNFQDPWLKTLA